MKIRRGEIWYCNNFGNGHKGIISGPRPVLVISNDKFNAYSPVINILGISGQCKDSPVHFAFNLNTRSYINCEQIYTISKDEFVRKMGELDDHQLFEVENLILFQLGI